MRTGSLTRFPYPVSFSLGILLGFIFFNPPSAWAGPPFYTDDPETVEYHHGEFYIASQYADDQDEKEATLPHFEFNYGVIPDVQLHLLVPMVWVQPNTGHAQYGLGDAELGIKYRFVHETGTVPQIGVFPLIHVPTGDNARGLGSGQTSGFLPLWIQKNFDPWTTYGGGGYWLNPGQGNRNFWQLGWLVQREITQALALGAEIYYFSKDANDGSDRTGYNLGLIFDLTENHHCLFSAGRDMVGNNRFSYYLGYQYTFGPQEDAKK